MPDLRDNITRIFAEREEFLVVGLTGRIGSGCSEAAEILCSEKNQLRINRIEPVSGETMNDSAREKRIIERFYVTHWHAFELIRVRTIITMYLLENPDMLFAEIRNSVNANDAKDTGGEYLCSKVQSRLRENLRKEIEAFNVELQDEISNIFNEYSENARKNIVLLFEYVRTLKREGKNVQNEFNKAADEILGMIFGERYNISREIEYGMRYTYFEFVNHLLTIRSALESVSYFDYIYEKCGTEIWKEMCNFDKEPIVDLKDGYENLNENILEFCKVKHILPAISDEIHDELGKDFTLLFQKYGNNIRRYGSAYICDNEDKDENGHNDSYSIPRSINRFIKVLRHPYGNNSKRPVRIVIDSIKNNLEAVYLRNRYTAFYLFAITTSDSIRESRLMDYKHKHMDMRDIEVFKHSESVVTAEKIFKALYSSEEENIDISNIANRNLEEKIEQLPDELRKYAAQVFDTENNVFVDSVRKESYANGTYSYYLQDIETCIENADIFISNSYQLNEGKYDGLDGLISLSWELVRNISLILYPGLVQPTEVERCMQIAFAAKVNSGCLSRQVGAVVTDSNYNILSVGWNDVPNGDISCSQKNIIDLINGSDQGAYTEYEIRNSEFRNRINKYGLFAVYSG